MAVAFNPISVTHLDLAEPAGTTADRLPRGASRVLVRLLERPLGFVELDLGGDDPAAAIRSLAATQLASELAGRLRALGLGGTPLEDLPAALDGVPRPFSDLVDLPFVSVAVCTRDRAASLRRCLSALAAVHYPDLEVVVVDNAPNTSATRDVIDELGDPRLRYVHEPRPGLSRARNRALQEARGDVVAFTDDDVEVDPLWLRALMATFAADPTSACVTGLVPTATLESESQLQFDRKVSWSSRCEPQRYQVGMAEPPFPLFPYSAGQFGTGANFAVRRSVMVQLGAFDEALGAGSRTRGGEDLDAFLRVLLAGHALTYEPAAIVWHHHRADPSELRRQMYGYGLGLSAYLVKHLSNPRTGWAMLRQAPSGVRRMGEGWQGDVDNEIPRSLVLIEMAGLVAGPIAYARGRLDVRRGGPPS